MSEEPGHAVFHATAAQWRLYGCLHRQTAPQPLAATLATARVSRSSHYRWLKLPGFTAWLSGAWLGSLEPLPVGDLLPLGQLPARAGEPRFVRPAIGLLFSPYGIANLLPPIPTPPPPSRAARAPSLLTRLFRFHRYFAGKPAGAHLFRISRSRFFRLPPVRFQSLGGKKEH